MSFRLVLPAALAAPVLALACLGLPGSALAHPTHVSEASALSALPLAVSVAAPVGLLSGGVVLSVVAVEASVDGTVWVLERASDGARASLRFAGQAAGAVLLSAGTAVTVVALGAGWVLSAAGEAIAFIPNELGAALLYNERLTR
ncbi:hypothetical protein OOT46_19315 [Aquabacterium sp. A7-Y]|uniref:hypothetical protein n=1 Tax=Aquabacterium sp. A7-Y TaxID=1349605 RepID=UPI00223DC68C|nr:hypothetical protein [Aquabacterium sp. A7-Y]MCW7539990.1 hypothetical protein [Aquabacterium sp. A7-Y]